MPDQVKFEYRNKINFGPIYALFLVVIFAGLAFLFSAILINRQVVRTFFPEVQALAQFEISLAEGHLWFEEILAGDVAENPELVWQRWEESRHLAETILHGGETEFGYLNSLENPDHIQKMEDILTRLAVMDEGAHERLAAGGAMAAGTAIDQEFDQVFLGLFHGAQNLRQELSSRIESRKVILERIQAGILVGFLFLAGIMFYLVNNFKRREQAHFQLILESEEKLRQAQKMEAVGNLAGGIAHDFNNLLQTILGYTEFISGTPDCPGGIKEDVMKIQGAAERATTLTGQLLAFGRRQVIQPQSLELNTLIPELLVLLERTIGESFEIRFNPGSKLGVVSLDKAQLEQILMNITLNARDAMGSGGTLSIETGNVLLDEEFQKTHAWAKLGNYVLLTVTDTGCGISPEDMDKIFEPFFTTKEVGKGTGLGLATVYGIVKQNGGLVHVYSEVGVGTTFKIYLPLAQQAASESGDKFPRQVTGGNETILIAEDDDGVRDLGTRILEKAGYHVLAASDGQEAWEVFQDNAEQVDLALLDVVMPRMGGRQLQEAIHRDRPETKVLFTSGYSQDAIHTDFVLDEGRHLINKPYAVDDLLIKVREIFDS